MSKRSLLILLALALAIVAYYLPWASHLTAALSPGARDLAEWTTLLPATRNGPVPLGASFLLRMSFAALAVLAAWRASYLRPASAQLIMVGIALLMTATLLPPVEFVLSARSDPNYQQQFFLSLGTLVLVMASYVARLSAARRVSLVCGAAALVAALSAGLGLAWGLQLHQATNTPASVAPGAVLFVIMTLTIGVESLISGGKAKSFS